MLGEWNPVYKPKHKRIKPTQKQKGNISNSIRKKVNKRSEVDGYPRCEGCHKNKSACMTLENAHIESRGSIDHMTTENDLLRLCGPSTDSGTCHHYVESTKAGKQYMRDQREHLIKGLLPLTIKEWKHE